MIKTKYILIAMVCVLFLGLAGNITAKATMAIDPNGNPIPFCRTFVAAADTVVTVADSIAVPTNTVEAEIIVKDQAVYITDGLSNRANTYWVQIPAATRLTLPVYGNTYIRYKSLTGTAKIYFIWRKM